MAALSVARAWLPLGASALAALAPLGCVGSIDTLEDPVAEPAPGGVTREAAARGGTPGSPSAPTVAGPAAPPASQGCGPEGSLPVGGARARVARLSHREWSNAVRDLVGGTLPTNLLALTTDPVYGRFDNDGALLQVHETLRLDYQRSAETVAEAATKTVEAAARFLPSGLPAEPPLRARAFVERFGLRAYRRPLRPAELARYLALFAEGPAFYVGKDPFLDGVRATLEAFLQSPHFLYRLELAEGTDRRIVLGSYEVAAKLSFALTHTLPDAALLDVAARGELARREVVRAQAERLLATAAGQEMVGDLHSQLLKLRTYDSLEQKDARLFPEYTATTGQDMRAETERFVREVVQSDGGLRQLLVSRFTFANRRLAPIYKLPGTYGDTLTRVELDPLQRTGILTHAGFLARNADATEISSIHRGVSVHYDLLCTKLPPPAPGATLKGAVGRTNRQRIESITGPGTCGAACHASLINPIGFAFEGYDALGRHRTLDNGVPIDASGTYSFGGAPRSFRGAVELSDLIAESPEAHECYAGSFFEYLLGRLPGDADGALIRQLGERSRTGCGGARGLVLALVTSDEFLTRAP